MAIENRIPAQKIVKGAPVVLDVDGIDAIFMDPSSYIGIKGAVAQTKYLSGFPTGVSGDNSATGTDVPAPQPPGPGSKPKPVPADIVDLSNIESITYEQYYDKGIAKYKCFIKIRNGSQNKNNVEGVDARIYNPNA